MKVFVTGAAGFIGAAVCARLCSLGQNVVGYDDFNGYYDPVLKQDRGDALRRHFGCEIHHGDVADETAFMPLVEREEPDVVIHLAAQAGVRFSLENPLLYQRTNVAGHLVVLEACRRLNISHLIYASSSSVYGDRPEQAGGFSESDQLRPPASLYAATKQAGEIMSGTYAQLFNIPQTGLRFFTVYGPQGRPDMAYWSFTKRILNDQPINIYNAGKMSRDFTYIDDIVDGIIGVYENPATKGEHRIFNIGDSRPVGLLDMVEMLEETLGRKAIKVMLPMQPGDVRATFADISKLNTLCGYKPKVPLEEGLHRFASWYRARFD